MAIYEIDESEFEDIKLQETQKGRFVIVKFGTELCDGCQALDFELEELEDDADISILSLDCNESEALTEAYDIYMVPTILIYNPKNELIFRHEGVILYQDIYEIINK